ncbi:MAG: DUF3253 domain-containing protein [Casimicrobiaceae bacterium]|nr:DUF3253 domain-containing protein [Casimicrobiaceae bacterium]MCX8097734.1 DUF3253 domain-containing protein [Casimicrobiaceae bacterium]
MARAILTLCEERAPGSICPSEVARRLWPEGEAWRAHMEAVREVAQALAREGRIAITQGGRVLDPGQPIRGPVRLRKASSRQPSGRSG